MARPAFNPGHYTHASGFEYQQDIFERETRERLLSLVDSYGIVSGFGYGDNSTPGNPSMIISRGLAYDGTGRRIKLTQAQAVAGISTLSGITSTDLYKLMVVENAISGVNLEAHPITGEEVPTKYIDYPIISLVASGAVDVTKHVRIGKINVITEGATPFVHAIIGPGNRDILSFPTSSPFVSVGPADDPVADFTGNDSKPFNDALDQIKSANNGGVIVIRPGTYTINPATPIDTNGLQTVRFIGMGHGVVFSMAGPGFSPHWRVRNCDEVLVENINILNSQHASIEVKDTERFTIRGSHIEGTGGTYRNINLISGITWAKVEDCEIAGYDSPQISFLATPGTVGGIENVIVRNCHFISTNFFINGEVKNFIFSGNLMDSQSFLSPGRFFSINASDFSQPKRGVIAGNTFETGSRIRCAASGIVITDNHFHMDTGSSVFSLESVNVNRGDYCVFNNNTIVRTGTTVIPIGLVQVDTKGSVIKGNTLYFNVPSTYTGAAIHLRSTSEDNLVDSNVILGDVDGSAMSGVITDEGTDNWAGITDKTSNKVL